MLELLFEEQVLLVVPIQQLFPLLVGNVQLVLVLLDLVNEHLHLLLFQVLLLKFHDVVLELFFDFFAVGQFRFQLFIG